MNRFVVLVLACFLLSACDNNTPDAAAQYVLGSYYDDGGTRDIDYGKARYWYEKSSARGNLDAMRALGFMYEKGKGMEVNYTKAIEIYTKAAEKGDYHSHINSWWMYSQGLGVEKTATLQRNGLKRPGSWKPQEKQTRVCWCCAIKSIPYSERYGCTIIYPVQR
ncbi:MULTISPECIES: tetratricopeptide repeat protein [Symbiopectobacterium]|uniref:tetratricopeptide repeat protein n=1 Tax=Symbiopectobacterium TaxID=801 RepID=UPI00207AE5B5|nr:MULTISPECIES: tetratricopeptide repeat protein [Symbiopectobacterium]MBT9429608.1 sel1 repeat family protein [Candidatus Symbiopectobacterium endolongispinus]